MGSEYESKVLRPDNRSAPAETEAAPQSVHQLSRPTCGGDSFGALVQAKLRVGPAGDRYELEADRVAAAVMHHLRRPRDERDERLDGTPALTRIRSATGKIRRSAVRARQVSAGGAEPRPSRIQRNATGIGIGSEGGEVDAATHASIRRAAGTGRPLDNEVRRRMESGFGADFSGVRVHTDGAANDVNRRLQAHAFTTGSDIFFSKGRYDPSSRGGQELLAHELTHVVQQGAATPATSPSLSDGSEPGRVRSLGLDSSTITRDSSDDVVRRQYIQSTYRLTTGATRQIFVEPGNHQAAPLPVPNPIPSRAILHETMVRQSNGVELADRFRTNTAFFPTTTGLTVAVNMPYRAPKEVASKKQQLTSTAALMVAKAPTRINVVKVLWEDGRASLNDAIRGEVPFAELRRHASADPGSRALYADLATQATATWRKMGDDDMQFLNPNDDEHEVHQELEKREDDAAGSFVSFSYNLTSDSADPAVQQMCTKVYKREAATIAAVREEFGMKTYAIEPTTYYRGPANEDVGPAAWNQYEQHSDPHQKQIKEGASFAKSLHQTRVIPHEYVQLVEPMPTGAGGRLNAFVQILERYMNANQAVNENTFFSEIYTALGGHRSERLGRRDADTRCSVDGPANVTGFRQEDQRGHR